jgi:hypothetical protein
VGDAIYGINDALGSIFGIVSGVSGRHFSNSHFILIAGLAGMVAMRSPGDLAHMLPQKVSGGMLEAEVCGRTGGR